MVSTSARRRTLDPANPSVAAALEHFELLITTPDEDPKLGELHAFGKYWIWAGIQDVAVEPLRLYQRTASGIADLTTSHYSLHVVPAGTWHQIAGLFGFWLCADADHLWLQVPRADRRHYLLLAGGSPRVNRRHSIGWHCQTCDRQLGQARALHHDGSPESFVAAQDAAVADFNEDQSRRRCAACSAVHPPAQRFAGVPRNDRGPSDAERVRSAWGDVAPRRGAWNAPIAKLAEIQADQPLVVQIGNRQIALIRDGNTIRGISGTCPHYAGPLAQGQVRHGEIVCPWHRFRFDLASGRSKTNPALRAPVYDVRVAGDEVIVAGPRNQQTAPVPVDPSFDAIFDEAIMTKRWKRIFSQYRMRVLPIEEDVLRHFEGQDMATRFMIGYLKGVRDQFDAFFLNKDRDKAIDVAVQRLSLKDRKVWETASPLSIDLNGKVNVQDLQAQADFHKQHGFLEGDAPRVADFVDQQFAEAALRQLGSR